MGSRHGNRLRLLRMNYPAAELRGIKMNFYLINPDAEHRGILLIKSKNGIYLGAVMRFLRDKRAL